jgi:hypothetical protein
MDQYGEDDLSNLDPNYVLCYLEVIPLFLRCKAWSDQTEIHFQREAKKLEEMHAEEDPEEDEIAE